MIMTIAVITLFIIGVGQKQSFRLYLLVSFAWSVSTLESCVGERFSSARKREFCSKNPPFGQMLLGKRGQGAQVWRGCLSVCLSLTRSQEVGPITRALQHGPYPGRLMNECREKISGCGRAAGTFRAPAHRLTAPTSAAYGVSDHWILWLSAGVREPFNVSSEQRFIQIDKQSAIDLSCPGNAAEAVKMVKTTFDQWRSSSETDLRPIKHRKQQQNVRLSAK